MRLTATAESTPSAPLCMLVPLTTVPLAVSRADSDSEGFTWAALVMIVCRLAESSRGRLHTLCCRPHPTLLTGRCCRCSLGPIGTLSRIASGRLGWRSARDRIAEAGCKQHGQQHARYCSWRSSASPRGVRITCRRRDRAWVSRKHTERLRLDLHACLLWRINWESLRESLWRVSDPDGNRSSICALCFCLFV